MERSILVLLIVLVGSVFGCEPSTSHPIVNLEEKNIGRINDALDHRLE